LQRRILYLLAFRQIVVSIAVLYELIALISGLHAFPFEPFFQLMGIAFLLNAFYLLILRLTRKPETLANLVKVQLLMDSVLISVLVALTGGMDSPFVTGYLMVILLSAFLLSGMGILVLTILCFSLFFFTTRMVQAGMDPLALASSNGQQEIHYSLAAQLVIFFVVAVLAFFFQTTYQANNRQIRQQREKLRSMRAFRNRIVESLHSGLLTCTLEGQITHFNSRAAILLRFPEEKLPGKLVWDFFAADRRLVLEQARTTTFRFETAMESGHEVEVMGVSCSSLALEEGVPGLLFVFQDLTDIKRLEQRRHHEEKMAVIGRIAAGVAHEIRNPLAAISGSVQLLREMVPLNAERRELIDIVEKESLRLDRIISDFLAYSKAGPSQVNLPFDLLSCFEDFLRLAHHDQEIRKLTVDLQKDGTHYPILGDPSRMTQAFWNVLRNSAEAMEGDNRMDVRFGRRGRDVLVTLQDHGCGIEPALLPEVFAPFSSFRKKKGTGLGLSIVFEIIQMHHGKIEIASEPGKGTQISITLPLLDS